MTPTPPIGRTLRHRMAQQHAAPTAAEAELARAIDRARHAPMFAAADDGARRAHGPRHPRLARAARIAAIVTLLLWSAT